MYSIQTLLVLFRLKQLAKPLLKNLSFYDLMLTASSYQGNHRHRSSHLALTVLGKTTSIDTFVSLSTTSGKTQCVHYQAPFFLLQSRLRSLPHLTNQDNIQTVRMRCRITVHCQLDSRLEDVESEAEEDKLAQQEMSAYPMRLLVFSQTPVLAMLSAVDGHVDMVNRREDEESVEEGDELTRELSAALMKILVLSQAAVLEMPSAVGDLVVNCREDAECADELALLLAITELTATLINKLGLSVAA